MRILAAPINAALFVAYVLAMAVLTPVNWLTDVICGPDA
jgi:hypothetical protein